MVVGLKKRIKIYFKIRKSMKRFVFFEMNKFKKYKSLHGPSYFKIYIYIYIYI